MDFKFEWKKMSLSNIKDVSACNARDKINRISIVNLINFYIWEVKNNLKKNSILIRN